MFYYNTVLLFILGLLAGSFLSVVISRLDKKEGFLWGRSKCPQCNAKLRAKDLIPVLSYVLLRGKCRKCQKKISLFYPFIEIITGLLFAFTYIRFFPYLNGINLYLFLVLYFFVISVLLVIFVFDFVNYLIPDRILIPSLGVAIIITVLAVILKPLGADFLIYQADWYNLIYGILIGGGFFAVLVLVSQEKWMGWGDVKLGTFLGIVLGYPLIIVSIIFSFILGTIYSLWLMATGKKTRKDVIPFGPFLSLGALLAIFLGKYVIRWYLGI